LVDKRAAAFIVIGPLSPDPTDTSVLLPIVEVRSATNPSSLIKTSTITCRIPSVQAKIRQRTIEGLQFFADDITHWLDGAFGDGSAPKPRDDLKMIGSRFFGSKGSSSASSSAEEEEEDDTTATVLRVCVTEADIALHVPTTDIAVEGGDRVLSLRGSDIDVKLESNTTGRQETALTLVILDAEFADRTNSTAPNRILARTTPVSLTGNHLPMLNLRFSSLTHLVLRKQESRSFYLLRPFSYTRTSRGPKTWLYSQRLQKGYLRMWSHLKLRVLECRWWIVHCMPRVPHWAVRSLWSLARWRARQIPRVVLNRGVQR
jgi:autophagy-related protein 2